LGTVAVAGRDGARIRHTARLAVATLLPVTLEQSRIREILSLPGHIHRREAQEGASRAPPRRGCGRALRDALRRRARRAAPRPYLCPAPRHFRAPRARAVSDAPVLQRGGACAARIPDGEACRARTRG